jgi:hypothetical protein
MPAARPGQEVVVVLQAARMELAAPAVGQQAQP